MKTADSSETSNALAAAAAGIPVLPRAWLSVDELRQTLGQRDCAQTPTWVQRASAADPEPFEEAAWGPLRSATTIYPAVLPQATVELDLETIVEELKRVAVDPEHYPDHWINDPAHAGVLEWLAAVRERAGDETSAVCRSASAYRARTHDGRLISVAHSHDPLMVTPREPGCPVEQFEISRSDLIDTRPGRRNRPAGSARHLNDEIATIAPEPYLTVETG